MIIESRHSLNDSVSQCHKRHYQISQIDLACKCQPTVVRLYFSLEWHQKTKTTIFMHLLACHCGSTYVSKLYVRVWNVCNLQIWLPSEKDEKTVGKVFLIVDYNICSLHGQLSPTRTFLSHIIAWYLSRCVLQMAIWYVWTANSRQLVIAFVESYYIV